MTLFCFGSEKGSGLDIFAVGDVMDAQGWCLDRQTDPDALHLMVSPEHERVVEAFLEDLSQAARAPGTSKGVAARYA